MSYSLEDFGLEREGEEARSEERESEKEAESAWNVITDLFEDDRYEEEEFHEEKEVGEEEEMSLSTTVSTIEEKVIEEAPSPVESEHVFAEIPIEVRINRRYPCKSLAARSISTFDSDICTQYDRCIVSGEEINDKKVPNISFLESGWTWNDYRQIERIAIRKIQSEKEK